MNQRAQIEYDSAFGCALTELARESETIVEVGTFFGQGSTVCLRAGLERPTQRLIGFEICPVKSEAARRFHANDPRIRIVTGTLVNAEDLGEFAHPNPAAEQFYWGDLAFTRGAPCVFDQVPDKIDLLVLDGGEWSSDAEFLKLWDRSGRIALDDTNGRASNKNWRARERLLNSNEWEVLRDELHDRHGWLTAKRRNI